MLGTLSRPLPKKQIGRLLMVDAAVIIVLLAVPVRRGWKGYSEARDLLHMQEEAQRDFQARLGKARQARREHPVKLGEIRGALDIMSAGTHHLRSQQEGAAIGEELLRIFSGSGLNLTGMDRLPPTAEEGFQIEGYTLNVQGRFERLLRLLHDLRNMDTYLIVERFNIRVAEEHRTNPTLAMEMILRTIVVEDLLPLDTLREMAADTTAAPAGEAEEEEPPPESEMMPDKEG